jgi:hypothetical protein
MVIKRAIEPNACDNVVRLLTLLSLDQAIDDRTHQIALKNNILKINECPSHCLLDLIE